MDGSHKHYLPESHLPSLVHIYIQKSNPAIYLAGDNETKLKTKLAPEFGLLDCLLEFNVSLSQ